MVPTYPRDIRLPLKVQGSWEQPLNYVRGLFPFENIAISFQIRIAHYDTFLQISHLLVSSARSLRSQLADIKPRSSTSPTSRLTTTSLHLEMLHAILPIVPTSSTLALLRSVSTRTCEELYGEKVRIQDVATGRVASSSTSFSSTFTTQGFATLGQYS